MTAAVHLSGITKRFGAVVANDAIDLEVAKGAIHGVIGENGAGKSTLMSILYGFYTADSGTISVDGKPVKITNPADAIGLGIGMVHQHFMLVPTMTVLENVMLGAEGGVLLAEGAKAARARLADLSDRYGLTVDPDALVADLPVGVQQRVEILKALSRGARVLILDEPTGVLTPAETEGLFDVLRGLGDSGVSIVLITHKLAEIMAVCDRVSVMRRGRMVGHTAIADTNPADLAELMVGRKVALPQATARAPDGPVRLSATGLTWRDAKDVPRLSDVSVTLRAQQILGVAGVSGNGQSELIDLLAGLTPLQQGTITVGSRQVTAQSAATPAEMRRLGVAHIPEDRHRRGLVLPFLAQENAVLGYPNKAGTGFWALPSAMRAAAQPLMTTFDVRPPDPSLTARGFSGGNQQKLVIAREFADNPPILLIGQPTRGVDIGAIAFIHEQILALRDAGAAILLVSVELDEILALSDRIMVMNAGRSMGTLARPDANHQRLGLMMAGEAA